MPRAGAPLALQRNEDSIVLMLLLPLVFYPFSKTLFLGFHLLFHPVEQDGPPSPPPMCPNA